MSRTLAYLLSPSSLHSLPKIDVIDFRNITNMAECISAQNNLDLWLKDISDIFSYNINFSFGSSLSSLAWVNYLPFIALLCLIWVLDS